MQILFRQSFDFEDELKIAQQNCCVVTQRSRCDHVIIVGRYSVLPYYRELEVDLALNGCKLINSYKEHRWIANFEYYDLLKEHTFPTWTDDSFHKCLHDGPFVLKGRTNSRKHQWNTHMFAKNKKAALELSSELYNDPMLGEQGILYRQYVPLETFEESINGLNFTNEWRFFFLRDKLLTAGYYWSSADKAEEYNQSIPKDGIEYAKNIANMVQYHVPFFVLDIAKTEKGDWIVVELNDGQMSGLSMCDANQLYAGLQATLN